MSQLTNFIPKTDKECRKLLAELREDPTGATLADRYGKIDVLNAEEVKALAALIEKQIGEEGEPKRDARVPATRGVKKSNPKSIKK